MKLHDGGATIALVVIGVIYFGDWLIDKLDPPPKQCAYAEVLESGVTKTEWKDCESPVIGALIYHVLTRLSNLSMPL